jgi:hypothetical protein
MSLAEIKKEIVNLTDEDRLEIAALLDHLDRMKDPAWLAEIARRNEEMDRGRKVTEAELLQRQPELGTRAG